MKAKKEKAGMKEMATANALRSRPPANYDGQRKSSKSTGGTTYGTAIGGGAAGGGAGGGGG